MEILDRLREGRSQIIAKKGKENGCSVSIAVSSSGTEFFGAEVASDSKLLNVTSEHVALSRAKNHNDFGVEKVVTLLGAESDGTSFLLALKLLIDWSVRTSRVVSYDVYNDASLRIFACQDVRKIVPAYKPQVVALSERLNVEPSRNVSRGSVSDLKSWALQGIARNFPAYDSASGYGVAVLLENGMIVYGGQYGSLEGRLGLHAEMSVILDALISFPGVAITDLALVSTKYPDTVCSICGNCLQFLAEISSRFNFNIAYHCFASEKDLEEAYALKELLPKQWTSKKW